ncbi:MAG: polysaccharide deacetylase family protein [Myxococcales bacterium]|nr:polysaccharide deacetylase family protein [Myxococcales bacterium]
MPPARVALYFAAFACIAIALRAVVREPPPLWVALSLALVFVATFTSGVLVLGLRMFVDAVVRGPRGARGVALTFDDGPHPVHTRAVLDILEARGVTATFFVIGEKVSQHPDLTKEIVERGHRLGVHSYTHDRLFSLRGAARARAEITRTLDAIEAATGERPQWFRPPVGHTNPGVARAVRELDVSVVGWSASARDGLASAKPKDVVRRIKPHLRDGAIVLLHDAAERGEREPAAVRALPELLDAIEERQLAVIDLGDWIED